jgi:aryl-alcohol dehydrogenase-like predicted oxidoreductase
LTGTIRSADDLGGDDWRKLFPRFSKENLEHNLHIADEVRAIADEADATPAQIALAWVLSKGNHIAPIPGTRRASRLEENLVADDLKLTPAQIKRLDDLPVPSGNHHSEAMMRMIERS